MKESTRERYVMIPDWKAPLAVKSIISLEVALVSVHTITVPSKIETLAAILVHDAVFSFILELTKCGALCCYLVAFIQIIANFHEKCESFRLFLKHCHHSKCEGKNCDSEILGSLWTVKRFRFNFVCHCLNNKHTFYMQLPIETNKLCGCIAQKNCHSEAKMELTNTSGVFYSFIQRHCWNPRVLAYHFLWKWVSA